MDFAGPFQGKMILIVIDSHSRWIEAFPTDSATSSTVIEISRGLFAQFGLPEVLVTDNGPCFVSEEFETFLAKNGIKHITSAPFHPATNGLAERAVQTVKRGLKKETNGSMKSRLAKVLMAYRIAPQSTTGVSPSQLLFGRRIRSRLDLLLPTVRERVEKRQGQQKMAHDNARARRTFEKGEKVYARYFGTGSGQKWIPAEIQEVSGPVSVMVKLQDNRIVRRHIDHVRRRMESELVSQSNQATAEPELEDEMPVVPTRSAPGPATAARETEEATVAANDPNDTDPPAEAGESTGSTTSQEVPPSRNVEPSAPPPIEKNGTRKTYPKRSRQPPAWYREHNH